MGKKKGRQSMGFSSKSQKAAFLSELRIRAREEVPRRPFSAKQTHSHQTRQSNSGNNDEEKHRPKLLLNRLRGILQERQLQDRLDDRTARRRRQQLLTTAVSRDVNHGTTVVVKEESQVAKRNAPGWILYYGNEQNENELQSNGTRVPSLQSLSIQALGPVLPEYLDAFGHDALHAMLDLFPSSTLAALSVVVSSTIGMNDELTNVLGKHNHVERLALHSPLSSVVDHEEDCDSTPKAIGLTDDGILSLMPRFASTNPAKHSQQKQEPEKEMVLESWEQLIEMQDCIEMEGCIRLKRLELVNARNLSMDAVSRLLAKCSCITHFSLSNSLRWNAGHELLLRLSSLLPNLQVLDVSHCSWITDVLLRDFWRSYQQGESNRSSAPLVCAAGCVSLSSSDSQELIFEFPGCLLVGNDTTKVCLEPDAVQC